MTTILIVEDNPANLKLALTVLEHASYEVLHADNAADGIATARRCRPDLILMDIQLPGMDGMAATRLLKADPATAGIPVVALTAFAMKGDEERILAAGCDGYIAKPFDYKNLLARVDATLHRTGMEK
jgi:two-component system, cell cycle response regulator DivK